MNKPPDDELRGQDARALLGALAALRSRSRSDHRPFGDSPAASDFERTGDHAHSKSIPRDVDAKLAAKGWMEVPSGGQTEVTAFGATREQPTLETFCSGFGPGFGGWYWGGLWGPGFTEGYATTEVVNTPLGTLVVDIFDSHNKHLIWRGVAQQALSGEPEKNERKLARAVDTMFRNFPPPSLG